MLLCRVSVAMLKDWVEVLGLHLPCSIHDERDIRS